MKAMRRYVDVTVLAVCIAALGVGIHGCGTLDPAGVYHGDKLLYDAELAIPTSKDILQSFVKWEYDNRSALAGRPEIRKSADNVRAHAKQWIQTAINLTESYKTNATAENRDAMVKAIGILRTALVEASGYMISTVPGGN